jgi:hypothetical protein
MKQTISFAIIALLFFVLTSSCSKKDKNQITDSDKFVGKYECIVGDLLNIEKIDANKISLKFISGSGNSSWDHTFIADAYGNTLLISDQLWPQENLMVTATGTLEGDVLTIDYHYDNGMSELGLIYNRIK